MTVVGRAEMPMFTWNPVEQMWIQERGGAAKPPPTPHDIHAIQTWFFDPDANEWVQTVLGPMGRQLAAQWRGAYRVPESAIVRKPLPAPSRNLLPIIGAGVVVLALIGGVAIAAPGLMTAHDTPRATSEPAPVAVVPSAMPSSPSPSAEASASPAASAASTPAPAPISGPVSTPRPRTPAPTPQPTPPPPPPDYVTPVIGPVGTVFHITFTGLSPASPYRTSYTRGAIVTGYTTGEVPPDGVVTLDLRTNVANFPPETYFFTIRAGGAVKTVTFRLTS